MLGNISMKCTMKRDFIREKLICQGKDEKGFIQYSNFLF